MALTTDYRYRSRIAPQAALSMKSTWMTSNGKTIMPSSVFDSSLRSPDAMKWNPGFLAPPEPGNNCCTMMVLPESAALLPGYDVVHRDRPHPRC